MDQAVLIFGFCKIDCNFLVTSTIVVDCQIILNPYNLVRYWVVNEVDSNQFFIKVLGITFVC